MLPGSVWLWNAVHREGWQEAVGQAAPALPPLSQVLGHLFSVPGASLVAQSVKNLPAM